MEDPSRSFSEHAKLLAEAHRSKSALHWVNGETWEARVHLEASRQYQEAAASFERKMKVVRING